MSLKAFVCASLVVLVSQATVSRAAVASTSLKKLKDKFGITHFTQNVIVPEDTIEDILAASDEKCQKDSTLVSVDKMFALDKIVNIAEKAWKVVEKNKPVVNVQSLYANALPAGVTDCTSLQGFSDTQSRSFRKFGKNLYGITVYDITYTVMHRYSGNLEGKGRYLENVAVVPHQLHTFWGYKVDMNVEKITTANVGSHKDPVASILLELNFKVGTVMKNSQFRELYEFRGDSSVARAVTP